jgi:superfamily I DNA/RNA helicase
MADVKGFEFSTVIVVGCGDNCLPIPGRAKEEAWRDALRLYVAMTRARDGVVLLYSKKPSPFLEVMRNQLNWQE